MKRTLSEFIEVHPVVMPVRNGLELTKRAIVSILAQDIPVQVHVVDNHSTDGTAEWLAGQLPRVTYHTFKP